MTLCGASLTCISFRSIEDAESEQEILGHSWPRLFEVMLECWLTDERQWPNNRTRQMFRKWFDIQLCPVIEDLDVDEELVEFDLRVTPDSRRPNI